MNLLSAFSQMAATAGAGPAPSQKPSTLSGSPIWVAETQELELVFAASQAAHYQEAEWEVEVGFEPRYCGMGCGHPKWLFNLLCHNACCVP